MERRGDRVFGLGAITEPVVEPVHLSPTFSVTLLIQANRLQDTNISSANDQDIQHARTVISSAAFLSRLVVG